MTEYIVGPDINSGYVVRAVDREAGTDKIVAFRNHRDDAERLAREFREGQTPRAKRAAQRWGEG
jgi:hypothetical protein